jgi:hypothetical protein
MHCEWRDFGVRLMMACGGLQDEKLDESQG